MPKKLTTKEFIKRSVEKHGLFYDYSMVLYINSSIKVSIICPIHGTFYQKPKNHLSGKGCCTCGKKTLSKKLTGTKEDFINRFIAKHGNTYDYSKVIYTNAETKVCIVCHKHGEFFQLPIAHVYGHGCRRCADDALKKPGMSTEDFISKAKKIHGPIYNYSKVLYVNTRTKICIVCSKHGEFFQEPNSHLSGNGCPSCKLDNRKLTQEQFIEKAISIHGNKYDYQKVEYKGFRDEICVTCALHGDFYQNVSSHLRGHGCPECGKAGSKKGQYHRTIGTESIIKKFINTHGKKYDYSKVEYKGPRHKVCIICRTHGEFLQDVYKHIKGSGCRECHIDSQKMTLEKFKSKSISVHGQGKYDYSKIISLENSREKVPIICSKHGEFIKTAEAHASGSGCPLCSYEASSKARAFTKEEFVIRAQKVHKDSYDYSNVEYKNDYTPVLIVCKKHGEFYQEPRVHLRTRGCPQCMYSLGERAIIRWFNERNIEFFHHYFFPDLLSPENKPLVFDFCTKHIKFLIEYDGEQHFRPVRFNSISEERAIEKFKKVQFYDSLKNEYCIKKGINLLRINYKEFNDISEILKEKLQGIGSSYSSKYFKQKYFVNELIDKEKIARDEQTILRVEETWNKIKDWNPKFINWNKEPDWNLFKSLLKKSKYLENKCTKIQDN